MNQKSTRAGKRAPAAVAITPSDAMQELNDIRGKLQRGAKRLAELGEDALAIATAPKDEVYREDMITLYRYRPTVEREGPITILIAYALVGRYQMVDLEEERSFVRKLLAAGVRVYLVDWGQPRRVHRWLTIDDYVSGYIDNCVDVIREREGIEQINLLGVCQGGVLTTCYSALFPHKVKNLIVTVTPIDFHADKAKVEAGGGYMNLWARALNGDDIDTLVDNAGLTPGQSVGFSFIMMNPVGNIAKYTIDLIDVLDDERKLLNFLRMERWIADRPDHPGEFVRQWFKDLYQGNKLVRKELELGGRKVDLKRVTMPVLNVSADGDVVIPTACSRGMGRHFGSSDYSELSVPGGHIGTFVGGKAQAILGPSIVKWLNDHN
jgi:polyhydroxyalkanoate synthase